MTKHKLIIDTDPGIDDAMAIHLALADERIELLGLTTVFGNVYVEQATRNALYLVEQAEATVPVAQGAAHPYRMPLNPPSHYVHGPEGFGDLPAPIPVGQPVRLSAAEFLVENAKKHGKELTICPVGPLTNIALALDLDPELPDRIAKLVVMGGAVDVAGNVSETAEANFANDPHAAEKVFAAGFDLDLVGLDVTNEIQCSRQQLKNIAVNAPQIGGFLLDVADFYLRFYLQRKGFDGCALHDPAAIIALTDPELFEFQEAPLTVSIDENDKGNSHRFVPDDRPSVRFANSVHSDQVLNRFTSLLSKADHYREMRLKARAV